MCINGDRPLGKCPPVGVAGCGSTFRARGCCCGQQDVLRSAGGCDDGRHGAVQIGAWDQGRGSSLLDDRPEHGGRLRPGGLGVHLG